MTPPPLSADDLASLYAAARAACALSYAPYSQFRVGAALRSASGIIITGGNVENAAYPQTICAERSAVVAAVARGEQRFTDLAIAYEDQRQPGAAHVIRPCGGCLSVLLEFSPSRDLRVHCLNVEGTADIRTLAELMPYPFEFRG